uniref:HNH endonuclease n=1 Tax=Altererythrobacter segetis TaxID=1104773 RepID=UPI00140DF359|nr:HNH endonuclease signature motif containing protein [Altererythrobacter segetis]
MTARKPWQHKRQSPSARGYDAEHRRIRAQLLKEQPLCEECQRKGRVTVATIADHIVPLSRGGKTERSNYQALCRGCSDRKTLADAGKRYKRRIGLDGWPEE